LRSCGAVVGALFVASCSGAAQPPRDTLTSGDATLQLLPDGGPLTFARGSQTLLTFQPTAFQVGTVDALGTDGDSYDPYWLAVDDPPPAPQGLQWRQGSVLRLESSTSTEMVVGLDLDGGSATLDFKAEAPGAFSASLTATVTGQSIAYFRVAPDADPTESFYGLGEWGDAVNHRGTLRPMQMEVGDLENGDDEDHVPVPLIVGTRGWGLFVQSQRPGVFDVARASPTLVQVTYGTAQDSGSGLLFHLFSEAQPLDVLKHYYDVTGYPGLPAPWAYGPLLWRDEIANQAQLIADISQIRTLHLAASGIWFDRPYATGVETFDFNPAKFPDPPAMLQALHDAGLRYGIWQAPYTASASNSDPAPAQLAYAQANGYFPPTSGILLNAWGAPLDLTNPAAYAWWAQNLQAYTAPLGDGGFGVEGFKLDYAEDVVVGLYGQAEPWLFADGSDELTMHYGYTMLYHRIHRDLLPAAGGFLLCRTGRWGDQVRGGIIWPGDLDATFDAQGDPLPDGTLAVGGLPAALIKGIGLSASGFPFYASDTGGYKHAPADNETWIRWTEANAVATAMEVGDASSQMPWEYAANGRTAQSLTDYQRYASLHLRLFPYVWSYAQAMAETGRPITRPFGLAYPALAEDPDDEYLFGDDLLVAPIVAAGQTSRTVLLPPGVWVGWWDGQAQQGGAAGAQVTVAADLDTLPLFLAQGGIVPMLRDTIDTLAPVPAGSAIDSFANDAGVLWARVAPGPSATSFPVYDGSTLGQQSTGGTLSLTFTPGAVFTEGVLFEVIGTPAPSSVSSEAGALAQLGSRAELQSAGSGWFWEAATGGTLWIELPGAGSVTAR